MLVAISKLPDFISETIICIFFTMYLRPHQYHKLIPFFHPKPYHSAIPGFVYGGLIASLVDCHGTGTAAAAVYHAEGRAMDTEPAVRFVTGSLHVDYLKPTPLGVPLHLAGRVIENKSRKVIVAITVTANDVITARGEVVAVLIRVVQVEFLTESVVAATVFIERHIVEVNAPRMILEAAGITKLNDLDVGRTKVISKTVPRMRILEERMEGIPVAVGAAVSVAAGRGVADMKIGIAANQSPINPQVSRPCDARAQKRPSP